MLQLFLRVLESAALSGEEGASLQWLFDRHGVRDASSQQYLRRLLQKDPRALLSEDGQRVVASEHERRRALGVATLDLEANEMLLAVLAEVAKTREQGLVSSELTQKFGRAGLHQMEKLVVLGLLVKKIVVATSGRVARMNVVLLPQFVRDFDPTSQGLMLEMDEAERRQAYDSLVEQVQQLGSNIVVAGKLTLSKYPNTKKKAEIIRRIVKAEERPDVPVLRLLNRSELPDPSAFPRTVQLYIELSEAVPQQQPARHTPEATSGHAVSMNENMFQTVMRELHAAADRGISSADLGQLLGIDSKKSLRVAVDLVETFKLPCQKFQEGRQSLHRLFPPATEPTNTTNATKPTNPSSPPVSETPPAVAPPKAETPAAAEQQTTPDVASEKARPRTFGYLVGELSSNVADTRRSFIAKCVTDAGGVTQRAEVHSKLRELENQMGMEHKLDTRTFRRLIDRLHQDGHLRVVQVGIPPDATVDLLVDTSLPDQEAAIKEYVRVLVEAKAAKAEQEMEESESDKFSVYSDEDSDNFTAKKRKRQRQRKVQEDAIASNSVTLAASEPQLTPFAAASAFHARLTELLQLSAASPIVLVLSFSMQSVLDHLSIADWFTLFGCPAELRDELASQLQISFQTLQQESPSLAAELLEATMAAIHTVISTMVIVGVLQPPAHLAPHLHDETFDAAAIADFLSQPLSLALQTNFGAGTFSLRHRSEISNYWSVLSGTLQDPSRAMRPDEEAIVTRLTAFLPHSESFEVGVDSLPTRPAAPSAKRKAKTTPKAKSKKKRSASNDLDVPDPIWGALGIVPTRQRRKRKQSRRASVAPAEAENVAQEPTTVQPPDSQLARPELSHGSADAHVFDADDDSDDRAFPPEDGEEGEEDMQLADTEVAGEEEEVVVEEEEEEEEEDADQAAQQENDENGPGDGFTPREDWRLLEGFLARFLRLEPVHAPPPALRPRDSNAENELRVDGLATILQRDFRRFDLSTLPRYTPKATLEELGRPAAQCYRRLGHLLRKFRTPSKIAAFLLATGGLSGALISLLNTMLDDEQIAERRSQSITPAVKAASSRVLQVLTDSEGKQLPSVMAKLMDIEPQNLVRVFRELWCRSWLQHVATVDNQGKKHKRLDLSDTFYNALSGPYSGAYRFVDQSETSGKEDPDEPEGLFHPTEFMRYFHHVAKERVQFRVQVESTELDAAEQGMENEETAIAGEEVLGGKLTGLVASQMNRLKVHIRVPDSGEINLQKPADPDPSSCPWVTVRGKVNEELLSLLRRKVLSTLTSYPGSSAARIKAAIPNIDDEHCDQLLLRLVNEGIIETRSTPGGSNAIRRNPFSSVSDFTAAVAIQDQSARRPSAQHDTGAKIRYFIRTDQF